MADIGKLNGITAAEAEDLRKKCEIHTVEALWLRISDGDGAWKSLIDKSGIKKERLIDLLAAEGIRQQGFAGEWFKRHWVDVLILLVALALAVGIWRRL